MKIDQDLSFVNKELRETKPIQNRYQTNNSTIYERTVALIDSSDLTDLTELAEKVKSMMSFSENNSKRNGRARICNICGKEDNYTAIMQHIEAKHLDNLKIPCQLCGKVLKTRASLATHRSQSHKQ